MANIMAKFTQKELKRLAKLEIAEDITFSTETYIEKPYWIIGISTGIYGINGCLIASKHKLYVITERSTNLFLYL